MASDEVEEFSEQRFCRDLAIANISNGPAKAAHDRGKVLGLIVNDKDLEVSQLRVSGPVAGSDHRLVSLSVYCGRTPGLAVRWVYARDAPWDKLAADSDEAFRQLHRWLNSQLRAFKCSQLHAQSLAEEASVFFNVVILGTI